MLLQIHQIKAPLSADIQPGDLVQWASWYMEHLLNGGERVDLSWDTHRGPTLPTGINRNNLIHESE